MKKLALTLALALAAPTTLAAPDDAPAGDAGGRGRGKRLVERRTDKGDRGEKGEGGGGRLSEAERGALKERVQQKIQTYLTVELSARAGLDEKKALQLGQAIKAHLERKQTSRQKKREELEKLRGLVESKGADAALKAQVKAVVDQHEREEQMALLLDDTARFLTPLEQAKVVLAFPDVMKDTQRMIRDARGGRGGRDRDDGRDER
jgi:hypothetical protein